VGLHHITLPTWMICGLKCDEGMATTDFHSVSDASISEAKTTEKNKIVCESCDILQLKLMEVSSEILSTTETIRILQ
jgi:hypothetical protein